MKPKTFLKTCAILLTLTVSSLAARGSWKPGDWVSWTNFRFLTSAASDYKYIYFGTTGGILRFNKYTRAFEEPWTESDGLIDNWVENLYYDQAEDEVVIDTRRGISRYNLTFEKWYAGGNFYPPSDHTYLPPEKYRNFFLEFGYSFLPDLDYIQDLYLQQFAVRFAYQEDQNSVWLGTWGLGVALGNTVTGQMRFQNYGLIEKNVKSIYLDGPTLYIAGVGFGSPSRGVTKYTRQNQTWEYWEPISNYNFFSADVNVIAGDSTSIWLGTKSGLVRYSRKEQRFYTYTRSWGLWENEITALKTEGNRLWIGTSRGLNVYESGTDTVVKVELPELNRVYIRALEADSETVWVGTDQGVYRLDLKERSGEKFVDPYGMVNTKVNHILKFQKQIWFASRLGILGYDLTTHKYTVYNQVVDLPGGEVLRLAIHPFAIWAATTNGAIKLDRSTKFWHLYNQFDGLLDNYVATLVLEDDYIWFGTPQGLTRFHWYVPGRIE